MQMRVNPQTDMDYAYVSTDYIRNGRVTANSLNVRPEPHTSREPIGTLSSGTKVTILGEVDGFYRIEFSSSAFKRATRSDVKRYLDPRNFINDTVQRFQFLDLSRVSGVERSTLNNYLQGRGILSGKGQAFINAGRRYGINEIYLLSHALLETGNGYSALATGVEVGRNSSGDLVLVTNNNRSNLSNIKTTYNMYGIGAVDSNAHEGGAFRAYNEGWFTPEDAIVGGAQFISRNYLSRGQNTLYKMRWNPEAMDNLGYASHQYATDIGWASKQVPRIHNLYRDIGISTMYFDFPEYSY